MAVGLCEHNIAMSSNLATLNEHLSRRPEPVRDKLAGYIAEHLDDLEEEMHWMEEPDRLTDELKAELDRRIQDYERNPEAGVSWEELNERLARSR